ncbi:MAG: hypothetical protein ACLQK8_30995 [Streptosporangiaceae bacterium]
MFLTHLHADHVGDLPACCCTGGASGPARTARSRRSASTGRRDPKRCQRATPFSIARPPSGRTCRPPARRTWSAASWPVTPAT